VALDSSPEIASEAPQEELGDPEEWDFFSDEALNTEEMSTPFEAGGPSKDEVQDNPWEALEERIQTEDRGGASRVSGGSGLMLRLGQAGGFAGWVIVLALVSVGIAQGLMSSYRAAAVMPATAKLGPFIVDAVDGTWVDTARIGSMYVVRGRLRNTTSAPQALGGVLQAVLLDSQGQQLDHPAAAAGWVEPGSVLRTMSPTAFETSRARAARELGGTVLRPGADVDFMAMFPALPFEAKRFEFEVVDGGISEAISVAPIAEEELALEDDEALALEDGEALAVENEDALAPADGEAVETAAEELEPEADRIEASALRDALMAD
jgi:hypothetical protein